jgi:hypothetical protein
LRVPRRRFTVALASLIVAVATIQAPAVRAAADTLPDRLSDDEFWQLSRELSEADGYFRSDNLLSNELYFPEVLDALVDRVPRQGVYLGVGPEQNFSYIAAVAPRLAFIVDVRRGNLHLHLLYKALFELSHDRADFVSRLFTKPRPAGLDSASPIGTIMDAFWTVDTSARDVFDRNLAAVQDHLTRTRRLPLGPQDLEAIATVYASFYWFGPSITYSSSSSSGFGRNNMANYHQLMVSTDARGVPRSFLASDEAFRTVQDLHRRNLIIPVVGNFGGARALRGIGQWVREREATVSMFYLSNVEQYLRQDGLHGVFCANVASMPLTERSTFVRSQSGGGGFRNMLGDMYAESRPCLPTVSSPAVAPPLAAVP